MGRCKIAEVLKVVGTAEIYELYRGDTVEKMDGGVRWKDYL